MRLMVELYARQLFFRFFFIKNKKAGPARKMMWVFILFILLVKKLLLWTDAIPLCRVFIRHALYGGVSTLLEITPLDDVICQAK